jgi:hypothetical protein
MGIKQFSSSLADFNQGQLDSIQTSSNTIKTSTDTIKTTVDSIKNTDLSNVSNSMREKKTSKFTRSGTAFFSAQYNVYGTVLNLTGNGFIDHALFEAFDNSNNRPAR